MNKRKMGTVALLMAGIVLVSGIITAFTGVSHSAADADLRVVASFYPVYIAALNVTDGVEGVSLESLAGPQTGCLHDYQLSPDNQIALERADVLLLNGAGAESFLEDVLTAMPDLATVDLSVGVDLLPADGDDHDHADESDHDHDHDHIDNEHIWTSPARYAAQVQNLCDGLCALDAANAAAYRANTARYLEQIGEIQAQLDALAAELEDTDCLIFHPSLAYLADDLGLPVVATIPIGEDTAVSAATLAQAEQAIDPQRPLWLLYDDQFATDDYDYLAQKAAKSHRLVLDTAVQGDIRKDAWLTAMRVNLERLETTAEEGMV